MTGDNSWDVMRDAADRIGVKALAARLHLSTALIYKWCQEPPSDDEPAASGARNPLDRLRAVYEATGDRELINWMCQVANGFYVVNPSVEPDEQEERLLTVTQRMVDDFGRLLSDISRGIEDDGEISADEAKRIRRSWERLKGKAERFVVACERGLYGPREEGA